MRLKVVELWVLLYSDACLVMHAAEF